MKTFLRNFLLVLLVSTLVGVVFAFTFDYLQERPTQTLAEPLEQEVNASASSENEVKVELIEGSIVNIVKEVKNSVVTVSNLKNFPGSEPQVVGSGSGVFYYEDDTHYFILTNSHVINSADYVQITLNKESKVDAKLVGEDVDTDLAVLSLDKAGIPDSEKITLAKVGDSDTLVEGETVLAVGNALGLGQSVTKGIISALERDISSGSQKAYKMIQTDAAINPGNSGGGLFNISGELIGINSEKIGGTIVESMGFAIPINSAYQIASVLKEKGYLPAAYLGVRMEDVNPDILDYYNIPRGVSIAYVEPGSPAEKAGLLANDLILKVNGTETPRSDQLRGLIRSFSPGDKITITIFRYDHVEELEAVLIDTPRP
ncbi:MAG: PDZ domain-containing protein [Tissierellia bacterium]|nr:PDZ domain-containing protein [Tissierellia bacterium]